ncbi:MAG: heparan-alpha-glucosaminide N-acetyltransferase domain-containing protein [Candidatus Lokiarchaeota archaeon]
MTSIKPNNGNSGIINERFLSIDIMKALAIMGMIFANAAQIYNATPFWLKHAETFGLTWVDLIAPGFLYMLALNFRISFFKTSINQKMNRRKIIFKYINRYVFLFIIGALLSIRLNEFGLYFSWDILQVLSLCGLTLFLIKRLPTIYKIIIGSIFIFLHHIFLLTPLQETIFITGNAGIFGIFSWLSFSVFTSILSNGILK